MLYKTPTIEITKPAIESPFPLRSFDAVSRIPSELKITPKIAQTIPNVPIPRIERTNPAIE